MTGKVKKDIFIGDTLLALSGDQVEILYQKDRLFWIKFEGKCTYATCEEVELVLDDSFELQNQIETIRRWGEATVSIVVALFEPNLSEDKLEERCSEVADIIGARVLGNHGKLLITDDKSLKQMYKRFVEATLRWSIEKVLE